MAGRGGIEAYLYLLDEAFRGGGIEASNESQALLPNLATVPDEAWSALPVGASRSIGSIALHVASCKVMYVDYAFGPGTLQWGTPAVEPWPDDAVPREELMPWLEAAHARLVEAVTALADDAELERKRMTNWGDEEPTRWIVAAMITHDAYHAGEINHVRSLLDGDDRWRYVQEGFG
jgi:uncharacterized damage-inducible protein DinB